MKLDIRTLLFLTTFYSLFIGVFLIVFSKKREMAKGFSKVGQGILVFGLGYLVFPFNDYLGDFISIVIANWLIILGIVYISYGLMTFREMNMNLIKKDIIIMMILFVGYIYYTFIEVNVSKRIIFVSMFEVIYFSRIIYIYFYKIEKKIYKCSITSGSFFVLLLLFVIVRIITTFFEPQIDSFMNSGFVHALSIIIYQIMPSVLCISCFWLSNSLMEDELKQRAMTDSLTGLYNRHNFCEIALDEYKKCTLREDTAMVVMADLDYFKEVNDNYGHLVGDKVLVYISETLKDCLDNNDILGRYGGEEFILFISGKNESILKEKLEKLRTSVEDRPFTADELSISLSISVGGVILAQNQESLIKAIEVADQTLYMAKRNGRNRVELVFMNE